MATFTTSLATTQEPLETRKTQTCSYSTPWVQPWLQRHYSFPQMTKLLNCRVEASATQLLNAHSLSHRGTSKSSQRLIARSMNRARTLVVRLLSVLTADKTFNRRTQRLRSFSRLTRASDCCSMSKRYAITAGHSLPQTLLIQGQCQAWIDPQL